jgi:hypothetical protein
MFLDFSSTIATAAAGGCSGVVVADLNGDGESEVFVCGLAGPNRLLKWAGSALRDITPPDLAGPPAYAAAAADFDGDGQEELYVAGADGVSDRLLDPTPDGRWVNRLAAPAYAVCGNNIIPRAVAAIDRRGTGRYGFLMNGFGFLQLIEASPVGPPVDLAASVELPMAEVPSGLLVAPVAGDRPDVLCLGPGSNSLYRNTGSRFEIIAAFGQADPRESGQVGAAVDTDGDGRLDLCYGNADGPHRLMVRRPDGTFQDRATPVMAMPSAIRALLAADFDNDGFEELLFVNAVEPNRLFQSRAASDSLGWFLADPGAAGGGDTYASGAVVADLDRDGRLELVIANDHPPDLALSLFKGPRTGNAWLRVKPLTRFGAPARGAAVRLTAAGRTQVRVIDCGGGLSQSEPVAHFGLGRDPVVDSVTVTWPDGAAVTLGAPHPLRTLTVRYPGG